MRMQIRNNMATLPLQTDKRHFVVGDIHGRMLSFANLMEEINYNEKTDVIYSVGDLIDRGPMSVEAVKFFQQPNCYAIRGNHEHMLVDFAGWKDTWLYKPNGGPATLKSVMESDMDMAWLINHCVNAPIVLDVGGDDEQHAFRLVHAEMPFSWSEEHFYHHGQTANKYELGDSDLLWGRGDITQLLKNVAGLRPASTNVITNEDRSNRNTFCGHTPVNDVVRAHNTTWIDTYRGRTMTCVNAITNEIHQTLIVD